MTNDRRQYDRRTGRKTITISVLSFSVIIAVIVLVFIAISALMAVYYERKINDIQSQDEPYSLIITDADDTTEDDSESSYELITEPSGDEDDSDDITDSDVTDEE